MREHYSNVTWAPRPTTKTSKPQVTGALWGEIHRSSVDSPHKGPVIRKAFLSMPWRLHTVCGTHPDHLCRVHHSSMGHWRFVGEKCPDTSPILTSRQQLHTNHICWVVTGSAHSNGVRETEIYIETYGQAWSKVIHYDLLMQYNLKTTHWKLVTYPREQWVKWFVWHIYGSNKANLRDLKAATGLWSGNAPFGSKSVMFCTVWPWNLMDDLGKQKGISPLLFQALCNIS